MSNALPDQIPSLDLADFTKGNAEKKAQFVADLGHAFNTIGFVAIKNHGLTEDLRQQLYDAVKAFFDLPESVKSKFEFMHFADERGYVGKGKETAKGFIVADLKDSFHIGQSIPSHSMPANVIPNETPSF